MHRQAGRVAFDALTAEAATFRQRCGDGGNSENRSSGGPGKQPGNCRTFLIQLFNGRRKNETCLTQVRICKRCTRQEKAPCPKREHESVRKPVCGRQTVRRGVIGPGPATSPDTGIVRHRPCRVLGEPLTTPCLGRRPFPAASTKSLPKACGYLADGSKVVAREWSSSPSWDRSSRHDPLSPKQPGPQGPACRL